LKRSAHNRQAVCKSLRKTHPIQDIFLYKTDSYVIFPFGTRGAKGVSVETISTASTLRKKS
jgi:hypothetical protein